MRFVSAGPHALATPIGIMWGVESRLTAADDVMLSIIGFSRAELDAGEIDWRALTPPEYLHLDEAGIQQAAQSGGFTVPYQKEFFRKDGSRVPVLLVCAFLPDSPGAWTGYVVDLSPRLLIDAAPAMHPINPIDPVPEEFYRRLVGELVLERTRLYAMLDSSSTPIWAVDRQFRLLACNEAFQVAQRRISGRDMDVGERLLSPSFPDAERRQWAEWYARALDGEKVVGQTHLATPDITHHHEHVLTPMRDAHGEVFGVSVVAHDVSARMEMEAAQRASATRFRMLASASPLGVFLLDASGRCEYANERLIAMLHCDEQTLYQHGVLHRVHPDDRVRALHAWHSALTEGTDVEIEYRVVLSPTDVRALRLWLSVVLEFGQPVGFVGSMEDATERRALAERHQRRERMESLGTLAGGIAHDFNNMLGVVLGYAELALSEPNVPQALLDELEEIRTAGLRASDLVRQILTFSRQSEERHVPVDLVALTRESGRLLRATLPASIAFSVNLPEEPVTLLGHAASLQQVLMNLCVNAEHALRDRANPTLSITVQADRSVTPPMATILITDNGHGMPQDVADRIFEPFFTTKPVGEGTGMGLSVVHGTVLAHGGTISVQSRPGEGTSFRIALPCACVEQLGDLALPPSVARGRGLVLLVEDEASLARAIGRLLELAGYDVLLAHDGAEALRILAEGEKPGVVLSDVSMPSVSGDKLACELASTHPNLPIVLMTGNGRQLAPEISSRGNVVAVLQKPVTSSVLADALQRALQSELQP